MDIFHSTLWRYKLKADILAPCRPTVLKKTCARKLTLKQWIVGNIWTKNRCKECMINIEITVEELEKYTRKI